MLFIPYRMDAEKKGLPIITSLICTICFFVNWNQYSHDTKHDKAVEQFCVKDLDRSDASFLRHISHQDSGNQCNEIFLSIRNAESSHAKITELANQARPMGVFASDDQDLKYIHKRLNDLYVMYDINVPPNLTDRLVYDPKELNLVKMVTSTFSHADILHLMGNLLFFYIFAASVELIMGSLAYSIFITIATFGTSLAYSYSMLNVEQALPTLGLSGVVMAAVAALGVMIPTARIRCFFWVLIYVRIFKVPALVLALWYVGWDIFEMNNIDNRSNIDYVSHVSGAIIGLLVGLFYSFFRQDIVHEATLHH